MTTTQQDLASSLAFEDLLIRADRATVVASLSRGMAHDLRGPLQTLTLLTDPQIEVFGGADGAHLRVAIGRAVQHLAETINRFSQVYAPQASEAAPVIVDDLLGYGTDLQRYQRGLPVVEVELRLPGGLPPVRGFESHLLHVLLSLILNAKEALVEQREPRIVVAASAREGAVQVIVEDNGSGLEEPTRAKAFEPFFSTRPGHLGIGLTVGRLLVERQGGTLGLERAQSGGGRAVLLLPSWRRGTQG